MEGLPATKTRILSVVEDESWGRATIYDLEPEVVVVEEKKSEKAVRPTRKSMAMSHHEIHEVEKPADRAASAVAVPAPVVSTIESDALDQEEVFWCLQFFQSSLMATVLEDTITQLRILIECNSELRVTKTLADIGLLKALKYNVKQLEKKDELDGINPNKLNCLEYKLNKLDSDRNKILDLFLDLYVELSTDKCFVTILDFVNGILDLDEYFEFIIEDEAKNKTIRRELAKQLRLQRNHHKTVEYDAESIISGLKSKVEDASLMAETQGRYVDNWQAARTEQHSQVIFQDESVYTDSTEYYKRRSDHESRVHAEVESLTNIIITETFKQVEDWMEKYENDMEKIDLRIQIQRNDYQNMYAKRRDMERTYTKHDKEMRAWITFKEERAKQQLYDQTMLKSAITVQAWWRGLLVRKQLGPYRPKKKGKKKK